MDGPLEGSKLSLKQFALLAYWWAHDCARQRAEHTLVSLLLLTGVVGFWRVL